MVLIWDTGLSHPSRAAEAGVPWCNEGRSEKGVKQGKTASGGHTGLWLSLRSRGTGFGPEDVEWREAAIEEQQHHGRTYPGAHAVEGLASLGRNGEGRNTEVGAEARW